MSKSNAWETDILALLFNATAIANVADNAGSAPLTNLWVSLHTASPDEAGTQTTNEATYGDYARVSVARSGAGWDVTDDTASPVSAIEFPEASGGTETITHFAVGATESAGGKVFYYGTVTPNISVSTGVQPRLTADTTISED